MRLSALLAGVGVVGVLLAQFTSIEAAPLTWTGAAPPAQPLLNALLGVVLGGGLSLAIASLYSAVRNATGFGMGDVKLLAALGLYFGPYVLMVLFFGSLIGAVVGVASTRGGESDAHEEDPLRAHAGNGRDCDGRRRPGHLDVVRERHASDRIAR